ncbi:MAG: hypothetical protein COA57_13690 [Flavobacteriales bacterium]|nr:MAG: hypothetical protein COA57_13690 [Flavobacteriales bacterium]
MKTFIKHLFVACLYLSVVYSTFSQTIQPLDVNTLIEQLKISKRDTNKIQLLLKIADYYLTSNLEKSIIFAEDALFLSKQLKYPRGEVQSLIKIGTANNDLGLVNSALDNFDRALDILQEQGNDKLRSSVLNNVGIIHDYQGEYEKAMNYYLKALHIREKIGDKKAIAESLNNIGIIHYYRASYKKALEYYLKALAIREKQEDMKGIAASFNNIGVVYMNQGRYQKAKDYYSRSLEIKKNLGDSQGVAGCLDNIAYIYQKQGKYDEALESSTHALKIFEELGDKQGMAINFNTLGEIYAGKGDYERALNYFQKSLATARSIGSKFIVQQNYRTLAEICASRGKYKKAYNYYQLYSQVKDSIINEDSNKQIAEMDAKYKSQKKIELLMKDKKLKEAEIAMHEAEKEKWKTQRNLLIVVAALIFALAFFIFWLFRQHRKHARIAERHTEEIEQKSKDITESILYAQSIQQATLPEIDEIKSAFSDCFVLFRPRDIVSGDLYWYSRRGNTRIICAVDCTGHGVPGGFMSMIANDMLNQIVHDEHIDSPDSGLKNLDEKVSKALSKSGIRTNTQEGMDVAMCAIHPEEGFMHFAGAKRPLWIIKNGELKEYKPNKATIGSKQAKNIQFSMHEIKIEKGDSLYIFTDGYSDQFGGEDEKKFLQKRFKELLLGICHHGMEEQKQKLIEELENWQGDVGQVDDILVIGIRI